MADLLKMRRPVFIRPDVRSNTIRNVCLCLNHNQCNLRCVMCWHTNLPEAERLPPAVPNLPRSDLLSILDNPAFEKTTISVVGGGEPFLYPYLEDLLLRAPTKDRRLMIMTNGTLLQRYPLLWEVASREKITLMFSIDAATPETYAQVRPPGLWDDLMRNIERVTDLRRGNPQLEISSSFVVLKQNVGELLDFLKLNAAWGSNYVHIHPAIKSDFPEAWHVDLSDPDYVRTIQEVSAFAWAHDIALDRLDELLPPQRPPARPSAETPKTGSPPKTSDPRRGCRLQAESMTLSTQGDIFVCDTAFRVGYSCGNLLHEGFEKSWLSKKWLSLRLAHAYGFENHHPLCARCLMVNEDARPSAYVKVLQTAYHAAQSLARPFRGLRRLRRPADPRPGD